MTIEIKSGKSPVIKEIRSLRLKKHRDEKGLFVIEGVRFIREALKEGAETAFFLVSEKLTGVSGGRELLQEITERGYRVYSTTESLYKTVSDTETPQGVLAVVKRRREELSRMLLKRGCFVILDAIQDPGNMGTIIRTADAAGAAGVILAPGCVDLYNSKVLRSTMGSVFRVPVCTAGSMSDVIQALKKRGIRVLAADARGEKNYFEEDLTGGIGILIGNEANGVSRKALALADGLLKIPMKEGVESLNAAVAASILMYEAVRQRGCKSVEF